METACLASGGSIQAQLSKRIQALLRKGSFLDMPIPNEADIVTGDTQTRANGKPRKHVSVLVSVRADLVRPGRDRVRVVRWPTNVHVKTITSTKNKGTEGGLFRYKRPRAIAHPSSSVVFVLRPPLLLPLSS